MSARSLPVWWGACERGWCGGAFLCERHAELLPRLARERWPLADDTLAGSEPVLGSPAPDPLPNPTRAGGGVLAALQGKRTAEAE